MEDWNNQKLKAEFFHKLHHEEKLLILPNIWEPLGALLLEDLGYSAAATASAATAYTNGVHDGENIFFKDLIFQLKKITAAVSIPVSADIEKGYADSDAQLQENIIQLIEAGIVGINIEDTDKKTGMLLPINVQCKRIALIKNVVAQKQISLFINARTDTYISNNNFSFEQKLTETILRGKAYKEAGADCIFPIAIKETQHISAIVEQLCMPVNILALKGIPDFKTLSKIGVARVSLGPGFLKIALQAMKNLAVKLQREEGVEEIVENEITSDYLKMLIDKSFKNRNH